MCRPLLLAICLLSGIMLRAQMELRKGEMMLFGIVEDERSGKPIPNALVSVISDTIPGEQAYTDPAGKYQTFIPLTGIHRLTYAVEGHHRKVVQVDITEGLDSAALSREWNLRVDIGLARDEQVLPDTLLDEPIGIAHWVPELREFQWDRPYTERYKQRFKAALKKAPAR